MNFGIQYLESKGINIDNKLLIQSAGYVRNALVLSSIGRYSEPEHLAKIMLDAMKRGIQQDKKNIKGRMVETRQNSKNYGRRHYKQGNKGLER